MFVLWGSVVFKEEGPPEYERTSGCHVVQSRLSGSGMFGEGLGI